MLTDTDGICGGSSQEAASLSFKLLVDIIILFGLLCIVLCLCLWMELSQSVPRRQSYIDRLSIKVSTYNNCIYKAGEVQQHTIELGKTKFGCHLRYMSVSKDIGYLFSDLPVNSEYSLHFNSFFVTTRHSTINHASHINHPHRPNSHKCSHGLYNIISSISLIYCKSRYTTTILSTTSKCCHQQAIIIHNHTIIYGMGAGYALLF